MADKRVSIGDVANHAGFSKTAISNYLNKKYETISPQTKEIIENSIKELGYVPNARYRNYKAKKTGLIGLIIPDITDPFCTLICKGITDAALHYGYRIVLGNSDNNIMSENRYIDSFHEITDGIIIFSVGKNDDALINIDNKIPIVLLDRRIKTNKYDLIVSDNHESIQNLLHYLISLDYQAFGFFTEELIEGTARLTRCNSFKEYLGNTAPEFSAHVYTVNLYDEKVMMGNLIDFKEKVNGKKSVIICANGMTLTHVLGGVHSLNLKIPDDLGICGYDDFEALNFLHSGITTIRQPTYDLAFRCVEQVVKRIDDNEDFEPKEITLVSKLIIRRSV